MQVSNRGNTTWNMQILHNRGYFTPCLEPAHHCKDTGNFRGIQQKTCNFYATEVFNTLSGLVLNCKDTCKSHTTGEYCNKHASFIQQGILMLCLQLAHHDCGNFWKSHTTGECIDEIARSTQQGILTHNCEDICKSQYNRGIRQRKFCITEDFGALPRS